MWKSNESFQLRCILQTKTINYKFLCNFLVTSVHPMIMMPLGIPSHLAQQTESYTPGIEITML